MVFYQIKAIITQTKEGEAENAKQSGDRFQNPTEEAFRKTGRRCYIFLSQYKQGRMTGGAIARSPEDFSEALPAFFETVELQTVLVKTEEITLRTLYSLLNAAYRRDYIEDDDPVKEFFSLQNLERRYFYQEELLDMADAETEPNPKALPVLAERARMLLCDGTLLPELDRIFAGSAASAVAGHPVHYLLCTDDESVCKGVTEILLEALLQNGRIHNRRYCKLEAEPGSDSRADLVDTLYAACEGGAVVIRCRPEGLDSENAFVGADVIEQLCNCAYKYRHRVLTVFCLPAKEKKIESLVLESLSNMAVVRFQEETACGDRARDYLSALAERQGLHADETLLSRIDDAERGYLSADLRRVFDEWFDGRLRNEVFPQYAEQNIARKQPKKPAGSAYKELQEMIGLTEAKEVIDQALDYFKVQRLFRDRGVSRGRPAMHMVFTGNPGTAKTTVARLFAQIMKENGLLSQGGMYEVGRADLVGKYVGWTAQLVKQKFRAAKGSVLFIDEAYSLLEAKGGMYGDEAINTIVQEMENNREDTVVIFAGYPEPMEAFLDRNPGLRSRIAFQVPFADYDAEELYRIAALTAKKKGFTLESDVRGKLLPMLADARRQEGFGNGRYVRSLIEQAGMKQARRLVRMDADQITPSVLNALRAEDFVSPPCTLPAAQRIGFLRGTDTEKGKERIAT